jgi:hypothetical protein
MFLRGSQYISPAVQPIPIQVRKCAMPAPSMHAGDADLLFSREYEDETQANH